MASVVFYLRSMSLLEEAFAGHVMS